MVKLYLDAYRKINPVLTPEQCKSIAQIVLSFQEHGDRDLRKLNYILATAQHESKLQPIKEYKAKEGTEIFKLQERYWSSGFYGRGFVQLTWFDNYKKMGTLLNIDLISNPDLALQTKNAADIIVIGMMKGLFTGVGLKNYFNKDKADSINARKIVNGLDKAELISNYYLVITSNLEYPIS